MMGSEYCEPSWIRTLTNNFYSFFVVTTVFITGTTLGVMATALLAREPYIPDDDTKISYENQYYDIFFDESTEPVTDERLAELNGLHVEEVTPQGVVRMEWDNEAKMFVWYSVSGAPHSTLETVARKFVCDHKCACLYFNIHDAYYEENERYDEELKAFREKPTPTTTTNSPQVSPTSSTEEFVVVKDGKVSPPPTKSVFATFKNYTGKSASNNGSELSLIREKHEKNMVRAKSQMNRFRRGGTLVDHDTLIAKRKEPPLASSSVISFGMFKRMRGGTEKSVSATN
jgi:hypothetical protein